MMAFLKPRDCNELQRKSQTRNLAPRYVGWYLGVLGLFWVLAGPGPLAAENPWLELKSLNFRLTTDAGDEAGRLALYELEQLHAVLPSARESTALEIFYFQDPAEVARYAPGHHSAGILVQGATHDQAVAAAGGLRALLHEYVHFAIGNHADPLWVNEGLAEYYSQAKVENGRFFVGLPDRAALDRLRQGRLIPVAELGATPLANELFYPESWALVHLMMTKQVTIQANMQADPTLDLPLAAHIAHGAGGGTRQYALVEFDPARFQVRPLGNSETLLRLTTLLPESDRTAALEKVAAMDAGFRPVWEQLGTRYLAASDFDAALNAYERAIELGSDHAESWYLAGLIQRFYLRDDEAGERLLYRAAVLEPASRDYRAAWEAVRESRREVEERGKENVLRARALWGQPLRRVAISPPAAGLRLAQIKPPRPAQPKSQPKPWIFAGAKLVGCSGAAEKRVCTFIR